MNEQKLTPEYLLSHGFVEYKTEEEGDCFDIPFWDENHLHFRETAFDRQLFVVVFVPYNGDSLQGFSPAVYVQIDAGCGFIRVPFPWVELTIEYFESVYYGIRGEKPKNSEPVIVDAEFEIVKPKQLQGQMSMLE